MDNAGNEPLTRLFALARNAARGAYGAETAFETRLMARIRAEREGQWAWVIASWRLVPGFLALLFLIAAWSHSAVPPRTVDIRSALDKPIESALVEYMVDGDND